MRWLRRVWCAVPGSASHPALRCSHRAAPSRGRRCACSRGRHTRFIAHACWPRCRARSPPARAARRPPASARWRSTAASRPWRPARSVAGCRAHPAAEQLLALIAAAAIDPERVAVAVSRNVPPASTKRSSSANHRASSTFVPKYMVPRLYYVGEVQHLLDRHAGGAQACQQLDPADIVIGVAVVAAARATDGDD